MVHSPWIVGGRKVLSSDLVLALTVSSFPDFTAFYQANRPRIHDDSTGRNKVLERSDRAKTEDITSCTVVLTFSNPPGQSRSQFIFGRDPNACDIVCAHPRVSNRHLMFGFDGNHMVMYDVSSSGSRLSLNERGSHRTCPRPGEPYKCILPPGCTFTLMIPGFELQFNTEVRNVDLGEFRKNRDAFLAGRSDEFLGALTVSSQVATEHVTPRVWRPMYWFESVLGKGGFGRVHKVRRLHDWAIFAAKEVSDGDLKKEMAALRGLTHERIVKFEDWYEDTTCNWILVMEYCHHGSLHHVSTTRPPFSTREITELLKQAAEGLVYLHKQGVTHRDLKPANILVRSLNPLSVVLSDFGLAKTDDSWMVTRCGTGPYIAPEIFQGEGYDRAVDIWALGIVGIELLEQGLPRPKTDWIGYARRIFEKTEDIYVKDPGNGLMANIRKMLAWEPEDRPTAVECVEDAEELLGSSLPGLVVPAPASSAEGRAQESGSEYTLRPPHRGSGSRGPGDRTIRSSEIDHYVLPKPTVRAAAVAAAPKQNIATQKRGADAFSRSNSLSAMARKVPRAKEQEQELSPSDAAVARILLEANQRLG